MGHEQGRRIRFVALAFVTTLGVACTDGDSSRATDELEALIAASEEPSVASQVLALSSADLPGSWIHVPQAVPAASGALAPDEVPPECPALGEVSPASGLAAGFQEVDGSGFVVLSIVPPDVARDVAMAIAAVTACPPPNEWSVAEAGDDVSLRALDVYGAVAVELTAASGRGPHTGHLVAFAAGGHGVVLSLYGLAPDSTSGAEARASPSELTLDLVRLVRDRGAGRTGPADDAPDLAAFPIDPAEPAPALDPDRLTVRQATEELPYAALGSVGAVDAVARAIGRADAAPDVDEELWGQLENALVGVDRSFWPYVGLLETLLAEDPDGALATSIEDELEEPITDLVAKLSQLEDGIDLARTCLEERSPARCAEVDAVLTIG